MKIAGALLWIGFCSAAIVSKSPASQQAESMFRAGPEHSGLYPTHRSPTLREVAWRFRTSGRVIASPAILNRVVYVGSADRFMYALRIENGSVLWKYETKGAVTSSAAVSGGRVFFSSLDGNVYALDARSGTRIWQFATGGERRYTSRGLVFPPTESAPDAFDMFLSSPAVVAGTVYVGSGDHNVYALDAATGAQKWQFRTGDVVHASPAVTRGSVYIGSWDRFLYKLDARTGALRWKFASERRSGAPGLIGIPSSAAVAGDAVYFGSRDGNFYAVNAVSGRLNWKHDDHASWVVASPAIVGTSVCFTTSDELKFFCLDAATGRPRSTASYKAYSFSSPAVSRKSAYFGTFDGWLHAVDVTTGRETARFQTDGSRKNASTYLTPAGRIPDDTYGDGTLEATILGLHHLLSLGSIVSSPAIAEGLIVFGSTDGTVYALR